MATRGTMRMTTKRRMTDCDPACRYGKKPVHNGRGEASCARAAFGSSHLASWAGSILSIRRKDRSPLKA